ncbi:MAG: barstar family protein [Clostridia bacterium]|nr:barstar family protein [Clostridia bacterium]
MRRCVNCKKIQDIQGFYDILSKKMRFPDWFGNNLDALSDVLGDVPDNTVLVLRHFDEMAERIGPKAETLRKVLLDSAADNPGLTVKIL